MKSRWRWAWVYGGSAVLSVVLGLVPIFAYVIWADKVSAYEMARVLAASFSVIIAASVAVVALVQYRMNSHNKRIERSMAFWQRANSPDFTKNLATFVKHWIQVRTKEGVPGFEDVARSDEAHIDLKLAIEWILDLYDEACAGVMTGACDEDAMYVYLGPIMTLHGQTLQGFVNAWRDKHKRSEKWGCFSACLARWGQQQQRFAKLLAGVLK